MKYTQITMNINQQIMIFSSVKQKTINELFPNNNEYFPTNNDFSPSNHEFFPMINVYFSLTNEYLPFDNDFFSQLNNITEIISIRQKIGLNIFRNIKKTNEVFPQWYRKLLIFSHLVKQKLRYKCTYGKTNI